MEISDEKTLSDLISKEDITRIADRSVPLLVRCFYGTDFARRFLHDAFADSNNIRSLYQYYDSFLWTGEKHKIRPHFTYVSKILREKYNIK
jgi:hypothetical protein